jgi:hypothetical protein
LATKKVYQTLEDRDNPDEIERHGPFKCNKNNAWMGEGYYFWESFIDNAHWWGEECNSFENGYIICEAIYIEHEDQCFNLIDNPEHMKMFNDTKDLMLKQGLYKDGETTVARIIEFLRTKLKIFKYEAVRVNGVNSKSYKSSFSNRTIFDARNPQKFLDTSPAYQICFYSILNLRNFRIIFPDKYNEDYTG